MTTSDVNFQAEIASVLDALVKVAVVKLTKLFDGHYSVSRNTVLTDGHTEQNDTLDYFKGPLNKTFQSIAVQVDRGTLYLEQPFTGQTTIYKGVQHCLTTLVQLWMLSCCFKMHEQCFPLQVM